ALSPIHGPLRPYPRTRDPLPARRPSLGSANWFGPGAGEELAADGLRLTRAFDGSGRWPRLRTLYPARHGVILRGSEVSDARAVPSTARSDAPDRAVLPSLTRLAACRRPAGGERHRLRDPQWPAVEGRAARLWSAQDAVQPLCPMEPPRRVRPHLRGAGRRRRYAGAADDRRDASQGAPHRGKPAAKGA